MSCRVADGVSPFHNSSTAQFWPPLVKEGRLGTSHDRQTKPASRSTCVADDSQNCSLLHRCGSPRIWPPTSHVDKRLECQIYGPGGLA
ncbi:hypothetical protein PoB_005716300 [Plakobranchus ocellatus]|uniref:Uncharacterized protein n=1 Tax=Plakobranchus ocellatus TaxID=259542 RepID=A0AAV4CHW9_9GAST|nr:hypothetical protein PoB_005716300 [Plakobranchus ocellatus]